MGEEVILNYFYYTLNRSTLSPDIKNTNRIKELKSFWFPEPFRLGEYYFLTPENVKSASLSQASS